MSGLWLQIKDALDVRDVCKSITDELSASATNGHNRLLHMISYILLS